MIFAPKFGSFKNKHDKGTVLSRFIFLSLYTDAISKTGTVTFNPKFNYGEFATIRNQSGLNSFKISVKEFVARTGAISLQAKAGRYGGTYAHKDIAFEFAMWISPEFKVYIVREFQRLKADEQKQLAWSAKRELSKINYRIHTDAIKSNLIPAEVTREQAPKCGFGIGTVGDFGLKTEVLTTSMD